MHSSKHVIPILSILSIPPIFLNGCAGSIKQGRQVPAPPVSVSVTPASATVSPTASQAFQATVTNDPQHEGVTWSLAQSAIACSPACGTISITPGQAVYSAPATVPKSAAVTLAAISVLDPTKSATALITLAAPAPLVSSVSMTPASAILLPSSTQEFQSTVTNDSQNKGVTWNLTQSGVACSPTCGTIVGSTTQMAIYSAPASVPNPSAALITATSLADTAQSASATITIASPAPPSASNGWVDVTKYGARSVTTAPTATGSCTSGSNVVALSDGAWPQDYTQFEDGDSIRLDYCGPATTMTPPTNVAVSPGMNAGGTPAVPTPKLGGSNYAYRVIACDQQGGCSAASEITSTNLGAATLGRVTANITKMALSNNVMTVTTTAPHGFVPFALIYIQYFSTQTPSFEGWYIIASTPSPTTFTFLTSIDSRIPGTRTVDTSGGIVVGFNCNIVSWAAVNGAWKYFVFGRDSNTTALVGIAEPGTTAWQDYGATMMGNFSFPTFVPKAPPSAASNQYLMTTISTGGGSSSIVVAAAAQNTAMGVSARMGSDAAIATAFKAAKQGTVLFPEGTYQVAGFLDLHTYGPISVEQSGALVVADTVQIPGGIRWQGVGAWYTTGFQPSPTSLISGLPGSYPTIYIGSGTGGELQFDHVSLNNFTENGVLLFYADSGEGFTFDYTSFSAGDGGTSGYMNRHFIIHTGGFDYNFSNCIFVADQPFNGDITGIGNSFLPSGLFTPNGTTGSGSGYFQHSWLIGKSAIESNASGTPFGVPYQEFDDTRTQNDLLPIYVVSNFPSVNTQNNAVYFSGVSPADYPSAITGNWAALTLSVGLQNLSNVPTGGRPLFVGNPTVLIGQNGGTASSGPNGGGWFATGGSGVGYLLPPPASPPQLTNSSGGAVPVGNHSYQIAWIDAFGNSTTVGPSATINIVSGMQTVLVTPPAAPAGAVGWQYYRDGFLGAPTTAGCGPFDIGASESDVLPFGCGNSPPSQNTALSSGQGAAGEETTAIELTGGGHKTVISGTFTAERALTVPDVSGTITAKISNGTVTMPTDALAAASCGTVVKALASGVIATDVVSFSYASQTDSGGLRINRWPTADAVNFQYCNDTSVSVTPTSATLNWQVLR